MFKVKFVAILTIIVIISCALYSFATESENNLSETINLIDETESSLVELTELITEDQLEPEPEVEEEVFNFNTRLRGDGLNMLGPYNGLTYYNQR